MKFTALPVNQGDAFLLVADDKYLLVDGGKSENEILELLDDERIKGNHLHYLACTHYDVDHFTGILSILESGNYIFDELWLPEIQCKLGYTINKKFMPILNYWRNNQDLIDDMAIDNKIGNRHKKTTKIIDTDKREEYEKSIEKSISKIIMYLQENDFINFTDYNAFKNITYSKLNKDLLKIISKLCVITNHTINTGKIIKWLKFYKSVKHIKLQNNIFVENAEEKGKSYYSPKVFFKNLLLSKINQESLVFCYEKEKTPNVLFTADSDLAFYKNPKILQNNSIVTAPHHGSANIKNNSAYCKIYGNDLIFVKGFNSSVTRISQIFKYKQQKYCTRCNSNPAKRQRIIIDYTKNGIPPCVTGKPCVCN